MLRGSSGKYDFDGYIRWAWELLAGPVLGARRKYKWHSGDIGLRLSQAPTVLLDSIRSRDAAEGCAGTTSASG